MNSETWRETVHALLYGLIIAGSVGYEGLTLFGSVRNTRKFGKRF